MVLYTAGLPIVLIYEEGRAAEPRAEEGGSE